MTKSFLWGWLIPALSAMTVAGALLAWQWPMPDAKTEKVTAVPEAGQRARTTADLVDVQAVRNTENSIQVTLQIEGEWHVNANPASLEFLIPTELTATARGPVPLTVDYPEGHKIDSGLGDQLWSVYGDGTVITAVMPESLPDGSLTAKVRVQACHDTGRCLTPDTIRSPVQP